MRYYIAYKLSYRDIEVLLLERLMLMIGGLATPRLAPAIPEAQSTSW